MTASYPLGTLLGSVPGGVLAARAGPKTTVCAGLALLGGSTLAFGFLHSPVLLDLARLVEGIGGACSWAGGLAWIVAEAPPDRRGALIGGALGAAIAGALFGPLIGTVATAVGRGADVQRRRRPRARSDRRGPPPAHRPTSPPSRASATCSTSLRARRDRSACGSSTLPAIASGMINVLGPLRMHRLGASAAGIGAAFLVAAAIEAVLSPMIGRGLGPARPASSRCASA